MGCNCGNKAGANRNTNAAQAAARATAKHRRAAVRYRLTLPNGVARDYVTAHEANAANRRAGGQGTITAVNQ
ncbi:DUF7196 family protein [Streptomyces marispadix]|uniref:DUF7196 domain-containing protein n=1 Tax=Streptomyces marispadix TaxID=2922868 RepID=A0ABS9SUF7_9ACTN|nr:hypothetical protein [Streptomyces marispadix]MCH6159902.1 hypothetical protein [Streptomyces marispadix]